MAAAEKDIEETMKLFNQNAAKLLKTNRDVQMILLNDSSSNSSKVSAPDVVHTSAQPALQTHLSSSSAAVTVSSSQKNSASSFSARAPKSSVGSGLHANKSSHSQLPTTAPTPAFKKAGNDRTQTDSSPVHPPVEEENCKTSDLNSVKHFWLAKSDLNAAEKPVTSIGRKQNQLRYSSDKVKTNSQFVETVQDDAVKESQLSDDSCQQIQIVPECPPLQESKSEVCSEINQAELQEPSKELSSFVSMPAVEQAGKENSEMQITCSTSESSSDPINEKSAPIGQNPTADDVACSSSTASQSESSSDPKNEKSAPIGQNPAADDVACSSSTASQSDIQRSCTNELKPGDEVVTSEGQGEAIKSSAEFLQPITSVAVLRATSVRRKASAIISFTTEDFDLFHKAMAKSHTVSSMKKNLTGDSNADGDNVSRLARRFSISFDHSTKFTKDSLACEMQKGSIVSTGSSEDSNSCLKTESVADLKNTESSSSLCDQKVTCSRDFEHFEPSSSSHLGKKLPRRKTTKKVMRKSTKRKADCVGHHQQTVFAGDDFDDQDDIVEVWEEVEFSETDSENEHGSTTDESDMEFENQLSEQIGSNNNVALSAALSKDSSVPKMTRQQRIANELLETERKYVKRLHLVDQVFHFKVVLANREHHMFPNEVVLQIFSNIKSIYQFHHDFLLPQLEKRMANWVSEPCIGDVMRKFAPFLKLYSEYVKNFDNAMNTMTVWMDKSSRFMSIVQDIQKLPECDNLSLQHHMLEPIQRVPRYELLLKDYLKHLPSNSPDREDTQKALELVVTAACHSNEAMKKMQKFRQLLDINESLGGEYDIISPTRELIKEGKIIRMSARNGDQIDRYLFLFNDLLLLCKSLPLHIGQRQQYHVKTAIAVDEMQIAEGDNLAVPNTFYVKGKQKSLELHLNSLEEKMDWHEAISNVVEEHARKGRSRRSKSIHRFDGALGWRAPVWIKDQDTSMCMRCSIPFTVLRRRHHCRACGLVVCGKCSSKKAPLAYLENQKQRVCDECNEKLGQKDSITSDDVVMPTLAGDKRKAPALLQVKANDPSVISGYMSMCCDKRSWQRRWFAVRSNFVLYCFKAHQDVVAMTSLPLPGYQVSATEDNEIENHERGFKIHHATQKKVYYFLAEDKATRSRWIEVLGKVVLLELPESQPPQPRTPVAVSPPAGNT